MRTFYRFLALVLTVITVVAVLPVSAFADAWVKVTAENDKAANTTQVTITVNADVLADILQKDGISPSLVQSLKAGIAVDTDELLKAFTIEELFEIVPKDDFFAIFKPEEILEKIGMDVLLGYIDDPAELIKKVDADALVNSLDLDRLIGDLNGVDSLADLVAKLDTDKLIEAVGGIDALMQYIDVPTLLEELGGAAYLVENGYLNVDDLIATLGGVDEIIGYLKINELIKTLGMSNILGAFDLKTFVKDIGGVNALIESGKLDIDGLLTDVVISDLVTAIEVNTLFTDENKAAMVALLKTKDNIVEYLNIEALLDADLVPNDVLRTLLANNTSLLSGIQNGSIEVDRNALNELLNSFAASDMYGFLDVQALVNDSTKFAVIKNALKSDVLKGWIVDGVIAVDFEELAQEFSEAGKDITALRLLIDNGASDEEIVNELDNITGGIATYLINTDRVDFDTLVNRDDFSSAVDQAAVAESLKAMSPVELFGFVDVKEFINTVAPEKALGLLGGMDNILDRGYITTQQISDAIDDNTLNSILNGISDITTFVKVNELFSDGVVTVQELNSNGIVTFDVIWGRLDTDELNDLGIYSNAVAQVNAWPNYDGLNLTDAIQNQWDALKTVNGLYKAVIDQLMANDEAIKALKLYDVISDQVKSWTDKQISDLGLYSKIIDQLMAPGSTAVADLGLYKKAMDQLMADTALVEQLGLYKAVMNQLTFAKIQELGLMDAVMEEFDNEELLEIIRKVGIQDYIKPLLIKAYGKIMGNVDKLVVDGSVVAIEDGEGFLQIDAAALVKAIAKLVPTLEEFVALDNNNQAIISTAWELTYKVDKATDPNQPVKTKTIVIEVNLDGNIDRLKESAGKLSKLLKQYINEFSFENGVLTLDANVPSAVTKLYAKALELDTLDDELKCKLLNVANMDGDELVAFTQELTLEEIAAIMKAVEPSKLYNVIRNQTYVQAVLAKVEEKTGYDLSGMTLDELVDKAATLPSMQAIADKIAEKTGKNVMSYIEKLAVKADDVKDVAAVQNLLNKISSAFGFDLSDLSAEELLNKAKTQPIFDVISEAVSAKVGVNIKEKLLNENVDDLYASLVDKITEKEETYKKLTGYIAAKADLLPDSLMKVSLAELYRGKGVFSATGGKTFNAKELIEKVLNKLAGKIEVAGVDVVEIVNFFMDRVQGGEAFTLRADLTFNFADLYRIDYYDRTRQNLLFSAFLPAGADLSVFKNNMDITGYEFTSWATADGKDVAVMPEDDIKVYADLGAAQITFVAGNNVTVGQIMMDKGKTLADYAELLKAVNAVAATYLPNSNDNHIDYYNVGWSMNGSLVKLDQVFREDTVLTLTPVPVYHMTIEPAELQFALDKHSDGSYVVSIFDQLPDNFKLLLHRTLLNEAKADANVKLVIKSQTNTDFSITLPNAVLKQLADVTGEVKFSYNKPKTIPDSFWSTHYADTEGKNAPETADFYTMDILVDGNAWHTPFAAPIVVQIPYAHNPGNNTEGKVINVYTMNNGLREQLEMTATDTSVTFNALHFSDFVITNEVPVTFKFESETGAVLTGATLKNEQGATAYFPVGSKIALEFENLPAGYNKVVKVYKEGDATQTDIKGDPYTMPAASSTLVVVLAERAYNIYYYVNGELKDSETYAATATAVTLKKFADLTAGVQAPTHYTNGGKWSAPASVELDADGKQTLSLGSDKTDIVLVAEWAPINYTVIFKDASGAEIEGGTFENVTVEDSSMVVAPAVPEKAGYAGGVWVYTIDGTTVTVTPDYTNATKIVYTVIKDANVQSVTPETGAMGEEITVVPVEKTGYKAMINVVDANGNAVKVENGKFIMPASNVYVTVDYGFTMLNYTINGAPGQLPYGTTVEFTVTVPAGKTVANLTEGCELVSMTSDRATGTRTMKYAFVLLADNTAITYELKDSNVLRTIFKLFNGTIWDKDGNPESTLKNVLFVGWSEVVAGTLQFAMWKLDVTPASLLWLWILLAVLLFVALIVLIYLLHITGKIGASFLTKFACWLVNGFFKICLGVSWLGLKLLGLFGKSDKAEDYGFERDVIFDDGVAAAEAEKAALEATEEAVEEATEEVAVEATEEAAKEAETADDESVDAAVIIADEDLAAVEAAEMDAVDAIGESIMDGDVAEATAEETVEEATEEATEEAAAETADDENAAAVIIADEDLAAVEAAEMDAVDAIGESIMDGDVAEATAAEEATEEAVEETTEEAVEETTEEAVEETTEEAVEETTEEAVEETTEEAVEEATEEAVEEATEEAVEETTEEAVEEATEEAVEETTEEAVEETTEEAVEEATEEAVEETTEEAVEETTEEAVEETTEEASDEETKNQ